MSQPCSTPDCERGGKMRRGMCGACYLRLMRRGEIQSLPVPSAVERLTAGLERKPNGCLEWTGATNERGYGIINVDGKSTLAHRLAWGLAHPDQPLPPVVRHYVCDNPPCCDTEHLRPGTQAENSADMKAKGRGYGWCEEKTHCPDGHEYTEANTYLHRGQRHCKTCMKDATTRCRASQRNSQVAS